MQPRALTDTCTDHAGLTDECFFYFQKASGRISSLTYLLYQSRFLAVDKSTLPCWAKEKNVLKSADSSLGVSLGNLIPGKTENPYRIPRCFQGFHEQAPDTGATGPTKGTEHRAFPPAVLSCDTECLCLSVARTDSSGQLLLSITGLTGAPPRCSSWKDLWSSVYAREASTTLLASLLGKKLR